MIRLHEEFWPQKRNDSAAADVQALTRLLQNGRPAEKQQALLKLIAAGAEAALANCLGPGDPITLQFAAEGLWECWLNERGPHARRRMEDGIRLMEAGDLTEAEAIFQSLIQEYPDWAEALNKLATALYLRGRAKESLELCRRVVEKKPHHFGAWNGMALCAVQLEDWNEAVAAASKALRLQPHAVANREIIKLGKAKLHPS